MQVLVYVGQFCFSEGSLLESRRFFGEARVHALKAAELVEKIHEINTNRTHHDYLLILPGGYSKQMALELLDKQQGKQPIRRFVEEGGRLLGICGGASLSCMTSTYLQHTPLSIDEPGSTRLELLPIDAVGPFPAPQGYKGSYGYGIEELELSVAGPAERVHAYYTGGCSFRMRSEHNVEILARLKRLGPEHDLGAVVVNGQFGQGRVMLWAVHPETTLDRINKNLEDLYRQVSLFPAVDDYLKRIPADQPSSLFLARAQLASIDPSNGFSWAPALSGWLFDHFVGYLTQQQPLLPRNTPLPPSGGVSMSSL